jgi:hypothetical protein
MNCDSPASYTVGGLGAEPADYCNQCLPVWYREKASQGLYAVAEPVFNALDQEEPVTKKASKKAAPAVEADASESN